MPATFRQLLTYSLLATYASIALLGEGLHWLVPDEHHHGASVAVSSQNSTVVPDNSLATGKYFFSTRASSDEHDCEICEFLAHAVSAPPHIAEVPALDTLIVEAPLEQFIFETPIVLGLHAARGPPQHLA